MFFVVLAVACSTGAKRDDGPPMPPPTPPSESTAARAANGPKVYVASPQGELAVAVEVVATEPRIERGLMYRQHLPPDDGMLFMLGVEKDWSFWMRNTLIPLDMIFIARDLTIAGIVENAEPQTETLRTVGRPSFYVLEVNGGWTAAHHVVAGAKVRFDLGH